METNKYTPTKQWKRITGLLVAGVIVATGLTLNLSHKVLENNLIQNKEVDQENQNNAKVQKNRGHTHTILDLKISKIAKGHIHIVCTNKKGKYLVITTKSPELVKMATGSELSVGQEIVVETTNADDIDSKAIEEAINIKNNLGDAEIVSLKKIEIQ